jgi:hypothetical protein
MIAVTYGLIKAEASLVTILFIHGDQRGFCPEVLLSYCLTVLLSYCLTVLLSYCLVDLLSCCLVVLLPYFSAYSPFKVHPA